MASQGVGSSALPGRVVRLHFCCKAEVPIGSSLRVTGSTLWAPTHLTASDPSGAYQTAQSVQKNTVSVSNPVAVAPDAALLEDMSLLDENPEMSYTSSVEMVTSPDMYPIWKTRRPVVIVLHKKGPSIQHHYYRYMVVTPGASASTIGLLTPDDEDETMEGSAEGGGAATSNDYNELSPVMAWEDPFHFSIDDTPQVSTASFRSIVTTPKRRANLANLPYRTLDIRVEDAKVVLGVSEDEELVESLDGTIQVRLDNWNARDDSSYRSYQIREAINAENHKVNQLRSQQQLVGGSLHSSTASVEMDEGSSGYRTPPAFPNEQRIFFVCYHLPVVVVQHPVSKQWRASWSESLLAKTEGSHVISNYNAHWIGTVTTHPPIQSEADKQAVTDLLKEMDCTPLFLDRDLMQLAYYGFCKQVLWPAFHNIDLLDLSGKQERGWDQSRLDNWWQSYQEVNQHFAELMNAMTHLNDIVWIHDYHLSLLPELMAVDEIQKMGKVTTRKVFFLHIPFPTSQIFRELECGEAILQGMLHADVVGFHAFDHARHFLNASKRILGLDYESLVGGLIGVHFQGKTVLVTMANVSIEPKMVEAALLLPSVTTGMKELKQRHERRLVIGGLDIGQRLSGISLKLLAFERLLRDYPSWQSRVVMVQRVLLPGSRQADEATTVRELRMLAKRIADTYGPQVIDYQEMQGTSLPMDQRLALWKASDVLMVTPIREGLNHWPMEFIYAHKEPELPGVVIASEFSAVCSILNGALRVNPFDIQMSVTIIDKALSMDMQEREGRRYRDIDFVSTSPSEKWTRNVLRDLRDAIIHQPVGDSQTNSAHQTPGSITPIPGRKELIDSTAAYLARESGMAFTHVDARALKKAFDESTSRVLILDFNGTIVIKEPPGKYLKREILGTSGNKPPPEVIEALTTLCADPRNTVYVVSGDSSENVVNAVGHIPCLGLAASNGGHFSRPTLPGQTRRTWETFDLGVDWDAVKRVALPVLSKYTARSNGSFVKLTHFSIGWSYYSCDPEWGSMQASHLVLELESELRAFDVRFVTLKGVVEIVPRKLNKGLLVKKVLRDTGMKDGVDFILCMGDDISDEKMFTSVFSFVAEMGDDQNVKPTPPVLGARDSYMEVEELKAVPAKDPLYCYTVAVGKKSTHASQWVYDAEEVADILVTLTTLSDDSLQRSYRQSSSDNIFS